MSDKQIDATADGAFSGKLADPSDTLTKRGGKGHVVYEGQEYDRLAWTRRCAALGYTLAAGEGAILNAALIEVEKERDALRTRAESAEAELAALKSSVKAWARVSPRGSNPGLRVIQELRAERDELQLQVGDWKDVAEQFRDALVERGKVLGFFASVIKSGEPWTPQCDEMLRATFVHKDTAPAVQPSTDTWEDTRARCS